MKKVITYGTFDLLHHGHVRLLERAKALGDYLIVGVTADDFDRGRGKINVQQSLIERIDAVKATGIADEVIVEEYEGQKIDDIVKKDVDIFTVGSDWVGKFDYLSDWCEVVYLPRTEGVSSTQIRSDKRKLKLGLVGVAPYLAKFKREASYVNGIEAVGLCAPSTSPIVQELSDLSICTEDYATLLEHVDAVYLVSHPREHLNQIREAAMRGVHVLCESPLALKGEDVDEIKRITKSSGVVVMEALRTAHATAYNRMLLLVKGGAIGRVLSVDATCTSLRVDGEVDSLSFRNEWGSLQMWGPAALLPIFQLLGTEYRSIQLASEIADEVSGFDTFSRINLLYPDAVASATVALGAKSESELVVTGTEGYIWVPSPWWKTDYFEVRKENPADNQRCFYQLQGEGIREQLVAFCKEVDREGPTENAFSSVSKTIADVVGMIQRDENIIRIQSNRARA